MSFVRHAALIVVVVLALAFLSGSVGTFSPEAQRFGGALNLLTAILLAGSGSRPGWRLMLPLAVLTLLFAFAQNEMWLLIACGVIGGLGYAQNEETARGLFRALTLASAVFAAVFLAFAYAPPVWHLVQGASLAVSSAVVDRLGTGIFSGPSANGFWIWLALTTVAGAHAILATTATDRALSLVLLAFLLPLAVVGIGWGLYLSYQFLELFEFALGPHPEIAAGRRNLAIVGFYGPLWLLLFGTLATVLLLPRVELAAPSATHRTWPLFLVPALALGLVLGFADPVEPGDNKRVVLYNKGMLDWRVPTPGLYGLQQAGMFGMLPRYLGAAGFEVDRMRRHGVITESRLKGADVLVIINPTESFPADERAAVWAFVARGGGLLVMGDHTDLGGMMDPLNQLLSPVSIGFRFDSAFSLRQWAGDYQVLPARFTRRLDTSNGALQQSTGASLRLGNEAFPIVVGRHAFSDAGVRSNVDNGYLGDYRYQTTERLGDVVVVAGANHGLGRVVVFGDTSAFQNTAIAHSAPFLIDLFGHLAAPRSGPFVVARPWLAVVLAVVLVLTLVRRGDWLASPAAAALVIVVGLTAGTAFASQPGARLDSERLAWVDAAHVNRFSVEHWKKDSALGLMVNLARNGFLPVLATDGPLRQDPKGALYFVIAPAKPFTEKEAARLREFAARGGVLVLSVGWEERQGSERLLELAGVELAPVPLGPVPIRKKTSDPRIIALMQKHPQFREAWPILDRRGDALAFFESGGQPIVTFTKIGDGGVLVIADSYFLLDGTLEEETTWWTGNILFLRKLLREFSSERMS